MVLERLTMHVAQKMNAQYGVTWNQLKGFNYHDFGCAVLPLARNPFGGAMRTYLFLHGVERQLYRMSRNSCNKIQHPQYHDLKIVLYTSVSPALFWMFNIKITIRREEKLKYTICNITQFWCWNCRQVHVSIDEVEGTGHGAFVTCIITLQGKLCATTWVWQSHYSWGCTLPFMTSITNSGKRCTGVTRDYRTVVL